MTQNSGEQGQQQTHNDGTDSVSEQSVSLCQTGHHQHRGTADIYNKSVNTGGYLLPDDPADESIHRYGNGCQQCQNVAVQMTASLGIGQGDHDAAAQGEDNGAKGHGRKRSFQQQAETQGHPDYFGTDDGGGAGHGGMLQGFKPQNEMDGQKQTAQGTQKSIFSADGCQFLPGSFGANDSGANDSGAKEKHRPEQPEGGSHSRRRRGVFDKNRGQGNADDTHHNHNHGVFFDIVHGSASLAVFFSVYHIRCCLTTVFRGTENIRIVKAALEIQANYFVKSQQKYRYIFDKKDKGEYTENVWAFRPDIT